jgi:pimeloyl-ACP methyl ester carboxylesterase
MTQHSHQTAPTRFVEANGIRFAYRRFGKAPDFDPELFLDGIDPQYWAELNDSIGGVPLVFNQHFTGTMDHWDPAVTDGLAQGREVILFNNAGVSSSSGEVPPTFEEMGANAIAFIKALELKKVDVLGFSIGGFVAQEITLQAPDLVRRLVLVGTGPRGGQNMATLTPEAQQIFSATYKVPEEIWLKVHFTDSEASQAAGREFLKRFLRRTENRDPEVNEKVAPAQIEAIGKWGVQREGSYEYLKTMLQPTLVINGDNDVIIYPINSWILQQNIPNAQLIIYPDANHGSQYQYPERFVRHVSDFLSEGEPYVPDFVSEFDAAAPAVLEFAQQSGS